MRATKQNGAAKQGVQGLYAMAAFVLLLTLSGTAAAQVTEWSREASSPGNWATAANWSNGVPQAGYMVNVTNGGTAIINSAAASAKNLLINNSSTVEQNIYSLTLIGSAYSPALTVEGGQYRLNSGSLSVSNSIGVGEYVTASFYQGTGRVLATGQSIWLGWNNTSTGYWDLAGSGSITCNKLYLGNYGSGYFTQSAGKVTADELQMGIFRSAGADPHGQYSLHGGELQVRNLEVGMQGSALFRQSNGSVASTGILSIGTYQYDRDGMRSYELSGGTLNSTRVITGTKSQFLQTGGTHNTKYYQIGSDHLYNYTGGEFNINGGLRLEGALDFGNQLRTLNLTQSVVDFGRGSILNSTLASVAADNQTLIILPAGFDPSTEFASFSPNALVHTAGTTLVIPVDRSIVGWGQIDDHVQCAGSLTATSTGFLHLTNGLSLSDNASVELGTGVLTVQDESSGMTSGTLSADSLIIGDKTTGRFVQSGGSFTVAETVYLGKSTKESEGTFQQTLGSCNMKTVLLGSEGTGNIVQNGGDITVRENLTLGFYSNSCGNYKLSGTGRLTVLNEYLGLQDNGQGIFLQTGGTHTVTGTLSIGNNHTLTVGQYNLEDGTLIVENASVGQKGLGHFNQLSGTHTVNTLAVGPYYKPNFTCRGGAYDMSGGTLTVGTLQIGGIQSDIGVGGTFQILGPASINVQNTFFLGRRATFAAVSGSSINLSGASMDILINDPAAVVGLQNLRLIVDGGSTKLSLLEAASRDMGATLDGFNENFALQAIQIDFDSAARLVNANDNSLLWTGNEAMYVNWLILETGSSLDLNGLNLYCANYVNNGGTIILNGGQVEMIPEPMTFGLLGAGLACLFARKRK